MEQKKYVIQVMWHITNACNLKCKHCYETEVNIDIDISQCLSFQLKIVKEIAKLQTKYNVIRVGLLGGEPFRNSNLTLIVKALEQSGIQRIDISSNGTLITPEITNILLATKVKMVQISMEGPCPKINDQIRGVGSLQRALNGLRILTKAGIETGIMMTISRFNLSYIERMVDFAYNEGVRIVSFNRLIPIGQGAKFFQQILSSAELHHLISEVHRLNNKYKNLDVSSDDPLLYLPQNKNEVPKTKHGGCGAGIASLAIYYDGAVFPCRRLPISIGDINTSSLLNILESENNCLKYLKRRYLFQGRCGKCEYRQICGGCRAAAYALTGNYLSSDPQCWLC